MKQVILKPTIIAWIFVGFMVVVIFSFSSQNGESSVDTSGRLVDYIIRKLNVQNIFNSNDWLFENRNYIFRKILHFTEYGVLAALVFNALRLLRFRHLNTSLFTMILVSIIAAFDEYFQSSIPGRSSKLLDVCIDSAGALSAVLLCLLFSKIYYKVKCKNR